MLRLTNYLKNTFNFSTCVLHHRNKFSVLSINDDLNLSKKSLIKIENSKKINPFFYVNDLRYYSSKKSKDKANKPKVELRKNEIEQVIDYEDLINGLKEANEKLKTDLRDNFNLRLTPSSFEQLIVKTQEGNMKLGEISQVEVKSPNLYQINMIDTTDYIKPVFDAILKSNLNTNAQLDKTTINLPISKLTREKKEYMIKNIKLRCEQALKKMRELESKALRKAKENKKVSSDLTFNVSQHIKYEFELYSKQACGLRDAKIKEILKD